MNNKNLEIRYVTRRSDPTRRPAVFAEDQRSFFFLVIRLSHDDAAGGRRRRGHLDAFGKQQFAHIDHHVQLLGHKFRLGSDDVLDEILFD